MTLVSETSTLVSPRRPLRRWLFAALLLIILVGAFLIVWNNGLRNQVFAKNFGVVEAGRIYRSGQISARLIGPTIRENNIRSIVCLSAKGAKPNDVSAEEQAAQVYNVDRQVFPLSGDGTGDVRVYAQAVAAVDRAVRAGQPVLVHCVAGAQRTGGVIALYQMLVEHQSPDQALAQMRSFGHDPHDNPHLLAYLNENIGTIAKLLLDMKVISSVPEPLPKLHTED